MTLILLLLKATLLLSFALGVTFVMHRASAGSRHLVWLVALAALLALPALATWAPWRLPVLPQGALAPASINPTLTKILTPSTGTAFVPDGPVTAAVQGEGRSPSVITRIVTEVRGWSPVDWAAVAWGIVAAMLLGWLALGAWQVRRIVRRSASLDHPAWQGPLYEIADRLGLDRAPRLVRSPDVRMPFACGLVHCTIVLPAESDDWSAERRSAVLIHELGHVRRRDLVGHTLGRLACAFYWFHPLVWAAARRLRAESERACDDLALTFGARPSDYAEHLLDIVTCVRDHATPSIALAMAHRKEFEGRMLAILDPGLRRRGPSRVQAIAITGSLAVLALGISAAAPVARRAAPAHQAPQQMAANDSATHRHDPAVQPDSARHSTLANPRMAPIAVGPIHPPEANVPSAYPHPYGDNGVHPVTADSLSRATALVHALRTDSVANVRRIAAWALREYTDVSSVPAALAAAAGLDTDANVREMSVWSLQEVDGHTTTAALEAIARKDADESVREMAIWALGTRQDTAAAPLLESALASDLSVNVRRTAAWAIGQLGLERAPQAVLAALGSSDSRVRLTSAWAAMQIEDSLALPALRTALRQEKQHDVKLAMLRALMHSGEQPDQMVEWLRSPDPEIRTMAARSMTGAGNPDPWPWPWPRPIPMP